MPVIKDKLFFFGDYQGTRQSNGLSGLFTVPTQLVTTTCIAATKANNTRWKLRSQPVLSVSRKVADISTILTAGTP